jgi:flavin reductase (DIM6/NTAB) family NADH-FMN oxidoreductase RutF
VVQAYNWRRTGSKTIRDSPPRLLDGEKAAMVNPKFSLPINRSLMGLVSPKPVVLVTCVDEKGRPNIITIAAVAGAGHDPPMFSIAVRYDRYSHLLIEKSGEFTINVPSVTMARQAAACGKISGRDHDKFKEIDLTPTNASIVKAPLIHECPINIECRVVGKVKPGTHTVFVGQVVAAHVQEGIFNGTLDLKKLPTLIWNQAEYLRPGETIHI